uniref:Uncharacterized protein n=1 Tax=Anguilla anguilla TaxID=7936 RepID=A0A0E9QY84_ANGAN
MANYFLKFLNNPLLKMSPIAINGSSSAGLNQSTIACISEVVYLFCFLSSKA